MKRKYMTLAWALSAALWAGGCADEEYDSGQLASDHPVVFITEVTTDGGVRGALVNDFPDGAKVGLYGYCLDENGDYGTNDWSHKKVHCLPDKNLFDGTSMALNGEVWDYEGLKYWYTDPDYFYSFFAYYPYGGKGISMKTTDDNTWNPDPIGDPVLTYVKMPFTTGGVPETPRSQDDVLDVLYASRIDWQNVSGNPVPLTFTHLMTGLEFEVENYADAPVHISSLRLQGNFHHTAEVTFADRQVLPATVAVSGTYSGYFPVITEQKTYANGRTEPQKVTGENDRPVELMLLANYAENNIGTDIQVQISYVIGTGDHKNEILTVPVDKMTFFPGVKNIIRLEFIGDHLMLSFLPGSTWTLGGDDDIVFD